MRVLHQIATRFSLFGFIFIAVCMQSAAVSGQNAGYGNNHRLNGQAAPSCQSCGGHGGHCGGQHESCHCPDDCPRSEKFLGKILGKFCKCKDRQVLGLCVDEVQYGANAGPPSYGFNSHGAWYTGPVFGPGEKLKELKSRHQIRRSSRRAVYAAGDCCGNEGSGYAIESGEIVTPSMNVPIMPDQATPGREPAPLQYPLESAGENHGREVLPQPKEAG